MDEIAVDKAYESARKYANDGQAMRAMTEYLQNGSDSQRYDALKFFYDFAPVTEAEVVFKAHIEDSLIIAGVI